VTDGMTDKTSDKNRSETSSDHTCLPFSITSNFTDSTCAFGTSGVR
jgi:hypothetical protein